MRVLSTAVAMLLLFAASGLRASDDMPPSFLQPGHDYVLRFAGKSPFEQTEGIPIEPEYYKKPDAIITSARITSARITSARITYSITVFTVVELFGDSWVLVEHPKSIKDAFKWNYKRFAMAALTPKTIAILEATEDGKVKLKAFVQEARWSCSGWRRMGNALMPLRCESAVFSRQWSENRKGKRPCEEIGRSLSVADVQMSLKSPPMAFQCGPFSTAARTVSGLGSIRVLKLTVAGIV